ncbi:unnamed protein product [Mycena citricolor]|uniref:Uncharacterized protein n=1 Tax=Mycena citricolor TaxID=2018698 RepID=A0AAD2H693_9AGAR|nr:unnamed protein product [Mycena citricolor]
MLESPAPTRAARILRERCPACFGDMNHRGGDIQMGADGNWSLRHLCSAGDGPKLPFQPAYFVSKAEVDSVRQRILAARKQKPRRNTSPVSLHVIEACQDSFEAANDKKEKADPNRYDSTGVFVMTCRHSQVLFLANIDTPGEQQCYIIALLEKVASLLPRNATIVQAYDIGCVVDHSCHLYPILSPSLHQRVAFVINIMHSFAHEWDCQLVYSPRFFTGMGISDMEGVERFWSRMRKLIGMTRTQWSSRRIWILDGHTEFINSEGLEGLGHWLDRQQEKNLLPKLKKAVKVLQDCRISDHELRTQWREQKAARMAPRIGQLLALRKELDKVIALQNQIQTLETTIEDTKKTILSGGPSAELLVHLDRLEDSHASLSHQADALYSSLNIRKDLRNLAGVPAEFVKTLLIMHDLKINIRKRAVGSFYETEMLDRAVAGRSEALGTKLYQATRKALSKRQPVLYRLINRFNSLCEQLEDEMPPHSLLPLPTQLSTKLSVLKADQSLFEDICVLPTGNKIPRWLDDSDIRDGIQSMHSLDRCREELSRLNLERGNLANVLEEERSICRQSLRTTQGFCSRFLPFHSLKCCRPYTYLPAKRPHGSNNVSN